MIIKGGRITPDALLFRNHIFDVEEARAYYHDMVEKNMRLYNRCAAFAKGSTLVEGLEPE